MLLLLAVVGPARANDDPPVPTLHFSHDLGSPTRGLSGLALHASGRLVSIGERASVLLFFKPDTMHLERIVPIDGLPGGLDLEALCFLDETRFFVGTERHAQRTSDLILVGQLGSSRARIVKTLVLDYAALGLQVTPNHGIEGLARTRDGLAVAIEAAIEEPSGRKSALIRLALDGTVQAVEWIALTTDKGKISDVTVLTSTAGETVWAIERHFGIGRVLRFPLPPPEAGRVHRPVVEADLAKGCARAQEILANLEGLAIVPPNPRGDRIVFADDDSSGPTSPLKAVRYAAP